MSLSTNSAIACHGVWERSFRIRRVPIASGPMTSCMVMRYTFPFVLLGWIESVPSFCLMIS